MKIKLLSIFKYFACCACFLSLFPFIALINGMFSDNYSDSDCLFQLLLIIAVGFCGYLFSFLFQNKRRKFPVRINLLFAASFIFPIGITFVLLHNKGILLSALIIILSAVSYKIGGSLFYMNYGNIMSKITFVSVMFLNAASILILWATNNPYNVTFFIAVFILIAIFFGIVSNQSNIDYLMERRQHKLENLPRKIRIYNIRLMAVIFLLVVLSFLMKDWLVALLYLILDALREIIKIIIYVIKFLGELFASNEIAEDNPIQNQVQQILPAQEEGSDSNWLIALVLILFVVFIVKQRKKILHFILSLLQKLFEFIKRLLQNTHFVNKAATDNEYYYDDEEYIKPEQIIKQKNFKENLKQWRKDCKKFYKIEDSAEKYRQGYGILIDGLMLSGLKIIKSDTANEIYDKSKKVISIENYKFVTDEYNLIRYDNNNLKVNDMESLYEALHIIENSVAKH